MAKSRKHSNSYRFPGLFDGLDDFQERMDSDFKVIPAKKMDEIVRDMRRKQASANALDEMAPLSPTDHIFFMSFGSGSSGNCSYIGDRQSGFLIDAGVETRKVVDSLKANGVSMDAVKGICLTHDHGDHIRYVYNIVRSYRHIRIYCTPKAFNGILRRHSVSRRIKDYHVAVYKEFPFKIGNFEVTAFDVMHDGADNAGFFIRHGERTFAIATDLGCVSERVDYYMRQARYIVIEANYDAVMLRDGAYPEYLKARIANDNGHMDNAATAAYIARIYTPELRNIYLCHLSHDNNTPEKALTAVSDALRGVGVTRIGNGIVSLAAGDSEDEAPQVHLVALPRYDCSPLYTL
ncbi:MAG: MBL fold metallo-hydrolase [Duncaniella sp.]|nr:MBL fold metallo-hydrolase [Duncaniella sp.]